MAAGLVADGAFVPALASRIFGLVLQVEVFVLPV